MTARPFLAIAAALPLVLASSARAEETPVAEAPAPAPAEALAAPTPAPAEALAAPTPAPAESGQVDAAAVKAATRQLSWGGIGVRVGFLSLSAKAEDVPVFGSDITKNRKLANTYIAAFNEAVASWNQANPDNQVAPADPYGDDVLDIDATLVQIIPTFHMGGDGYFFKLETPIGFGDGMTSLGLGLYPINYGYYIESIGLFPYLSAGMVLNYAQASSYSGANGNVDVSQVGGIIQGRVAVGGKYALSDAFTGTLELGFTPWGFAGLLDTDKADKIAKQGELAPEDIIDPATMRPIDPGSAIRGGQISSALDLSVGIEWL